MNTSHKAWNLRRLRNLGPYLAMALVLPGGSLLALLLWLFQHRHWKA